ncbi:DUF4214 domain-containing protein [Pseudomonas oryzihabitans]|uniref:DUF4214 domain-containing protein n=1 Tax=Pseudomonas oryzihabitans TaxID=47885 RepID=UPI0028A0E0C6|nr:DUF4214 domain-containing protein [Pseudomonas oryzihabitans]
MAGGDNLGLLIQLEATTAQMRQELTRGENAVAQTAAKVDKSLEKVDSAFDRMAEAASRSGNILADGFKAAGAAVAGFQVLDAVKNATQLASRYNQLGVVLTTIGQNAGYSSKQLQGYEMGLQRVGISAMESRNNLARMISANLDLAQSAKLARVAQDAAVIGNISSSEAYARLVDGIAAAEVETLRGIGLNVNFENSYQALAKQLGVTSAELTEQQKAQARANVAIQAGAAITGAYEASLTNAGKMLSSTTRYVENLQVALGQSTQPAFTAAVQAYSDGLKYLGDNTETVVKILETGLYLALGRSAAALLNAGVARAQNTVAEVAGLRATVASADAQMYSANIALRKAQADLAGARAAVAAATSEGAMAAALKARAAASGAVAAATMRVEAASSAATVANGALTVATTLTGRAMTVATGAARGMWTALGGPIGIAAALASIAIAFVDFGDKAEEQSDRAAKSMETAAIRIRQAVRDMTPGNLGAMTLDQLKAQRASLEQQLEQTEKVQASLQAMADGDVPTVGGPTLEQTNEKAEALRGAIANVTKELDGSRFAADKAGQSYTDNLTKQVSMLGAVTEVEKLRRMESSGQLKLSVEQRDATYKNAQAIDDYNAKQKALNESEKAGKKSASELQSEREKQAKALTDLQAQSDIAIRKAQGLADSYNSGKDSLYELTLQQKVEEELLKTGAAAREKVTTAIKGQMDAEARRDIGKATYDLKAETSALELQAVATLQGTTALEAFNVEKAKAAILSGKNVDALTEETRQYLEASAANQKAAKTAEQVGKVQSIMDRLKPESALLRKYTEDQKALNEAIRLNPGYSAEYAESLRLLDLEYKQNQASATAWGQFTEGAIDRVDDAFADAWKNIGKGFDGFATSLKDGFKQLLAELAHMAITKPIIMQIGAALGVGGLSASQSGGLLGGSGGGGGLNLVSLAQNAYSVYSGLTGVGSAIYGGYQVGGLTGAAQAGVGYYGNMLSSGANYVSGLFGGASGAAAGSAAASSAAGATAAGYTGQAYSTWAAGQYASQAMSNVASTMASYGPYFAAIAGALMGWQKAGFKGAVAGAAGAAGGMYAGAQIGTAIFPGIGTAIGGAIGAVAGAMFGSSLFGGQWQTKDAGLSLGVEGGDLSAMGFEYQKKKGGLFGKNKKRTVFNALDADTQAALDMTFDAGMDQIQALYEQFGIDVSQSALDGLSIAATQISTKGKTTEELQQLIGEWFTGTFDSITDQINTAMGSQFRAGLTLDGLKLLLGNLISVNGMLDLLNVKVLKITPAGAYAAEALTALAGGMDKLTENVNGYYGAFFTEAEKQADTLSAVTAQFQAMGVSLPPLRQGYRDIVESIDVTTAAGQAMFTSLTSLWQTASGYYDILQAQAEAAKRAQSDMLSGALGTLQRAVQRQQTALTDAYNAQVEGLNASLSASQGVMSSLTSMANGLASALKTLQGQSDTAQSVLYQQAQATLVSAAAIARAGGSIAGLAGIDDALSAVTNNDASRYGSWEDFARDQGRSLVLIDELNSAAGGQLDQATKSYNAIQEQIALAKKQYDMESAQLQGQLDLAQAQIDGINGIDNRLLTVSEALAEILKAIQTASPDGTGLKNIDSIIAAAYQAALGRAPDAAGAAYWKQQVGSGALSSNNVFNAISQAGAANGESITKAYQNILGRAPDAAGLAYWQQQVAAGNISDINAAIKAAAMANGQIPAFASGGNYAGGLALVGERGPEVIDFSRPGYVYNARDTAGMLSGADLSGVMSLLSRLINTVGEGNQHLWYINDRTRATADNTEVLRDQAMKEEIA